jgi:hypothetical protein
MASRSKRIMRDFTLREISCVDRPAQKGAMAMIMKREQTMDHYDHDDDWLEKAERDEATDDFLDAARGIQKRDGCTGLEALQKARREHGGAFGALQQDPTHTDIDVDELSDGALGKAALEVACTEIQKRDDCSRLEAMRKAREEQPALYHFWNGNEIPDEAITKAHPGDVASWANLVEGIKAKEGCSGTEAARRARRRYPELRASMQKSAPEVTKDIAMPSREMISGETAKADWNRAVAAIQGRDGGNRMQAMQKCRIEHPDLFAAFQQVGGRVQI